MGHRSDSTLGRLEQGLGVGGSQELLAGLQLRLEVRHKWDPQP
jgi:hypothetical protein